MERVAIYIRVASADIEQVKKQNAILQEWARKNYCGVYRTYIDNGYSGNTIDRPAFHEMFNEMDNFDTVVVTDVSRLTRNYKLAAFLMNHLDKYGKRFAYIN